MVQGLARFKLIEFTQREPHFRGPHPPIYEEYLKDIEIDAMYINLKNLYKKAVEIAPYLSSELSQIATKIENPGNLADLVASTINISVAERQEVLEKIDLKERLKKVTIMLNRELETLELSSKIQSHIREGIDKTQREYYLREQLKAIQKELGEVDEKASGDRRAAKEDGRGADAAGRSEGDGEGAGQTVEDEQHVRRVYRGKDVPRLARGSPLVEFHGR